MKTVSMDNGMEELTTVLQKHLDYVSNHVDEICEKDKIVISIDDYMDFITMGIMLQISEQNCACQEVPVLLPISIPVSLDIPESILTKEPLLSLLLMELQKKPFAAQKILFQNRLDL